MVHGRGHDVGRALVLHPGIAAVGFTGSLAGGRALCDLAASRSERIPVFAEMGSMNPVFVLPGALRERGAEIAAAVAASGLLCGGQFCTSPGMVLHGDGADGSAFANRLASAYAASTPGPMVHPSTAALFQRAANEVRSLRGVAVRAAADVGSGTASGAVLLAAGADAVLAHGRLREEVYGPAMLAVACRPADMLAVAEALHGHLTATVHGTDADLAEHAALLAVLRRKVGRIVFQGVPTGVEVVTAMQHGGPWPASSDSRFTAVGPRAILRWARPVCFQDAPAAVLPRELQDGNPCGLRRTVDGVLDRH
jgi:NADP-dependent aldehyde dehydrogenase